MSENGGISKEAAVAGAAAKSKAVAPKKKGVIGLDLAKLKADAA